jgi:hypothetical protein
MVKGSFNQVHLLAELVTHMKFNQLSPHDQTMPKAGILDCLVVMISGSQS